MVCHQAKYSISFDNGLKNVFITIELTRTVSEEVQDIVKSVIQRNAYFAHAENILVTVIHDEKPAIRELAWRRIKKARKTTKGKVVRHFINPTVNFEAIDYTDLVDWQQCIVTEPLVTRGLPEDKNEECIEYKCAPPIVMDKFPCHTQAVERMVKLVTEASSTVVGANVHDGFIRSTLESRKRLPSFETKADYEM